MKDLEKELKEQYDEIYTINVKNEKGKNLTSYIKKGTLEERKNLVLNLPSDDFFDVAEQYIKDNFVGGDELDEEALFSSCIQLRGITDLLGDAKIIETPADIDADFTIEAKSGDKVLVAHFKNNVKIKKKLFLLISKGTRNPFINGGIILHEGFVSGDNLTEDAEIFATASALASSELEFDEATIKKN